MARYSRALTIGPVAVTGAVALSLGGVPAVADEPDARFMPRTHPDRPTTDTPEAATIPVSAPEGHASGAAGVSTYTVKPGDTVTAIAIRHGLRTIDLLNWNNLGWTSIIMPGDELTLRADSPAPRPDNGPDDSGASGGSVHTVVAGDTLWSIGQRYGVTVAALTDANDLGAAAVIFPGQKLDIPGAGEGESGGGSGDQGQPAAPEENASSSYTVKAGDTLWSIAAAHDLSVDELLSLNDLNASSIIYPGQDLVVRGSAPEPSPAPAPSEGGSIYDSPTYDLQATLNAPQAENASLIISVGRSLGVSDQGVAIALATAMVESGLRNLDWGDRDSVGLFQQRPSSGWGSADELVDRGIATERFFLGREDGSTRGLLDISGWESMGFGDAAQAVQISAFPDRYDRWRVAAYGWLAQHG